MVSCTWSVEEPLAEISVFGDAAKENMSAMWAASNLSSAAWPLVGERKLTVIHRVGGQILLGLYIRRSEIS